MKKNFIYSVFAVAILIAASSCSTYRTNYKYNTNPVYSLEETNISNGTLETDLEMIGKIKGYASYDSDEVNLQLKEGSYVVNNNFAFRGNSSFYEEAKAAALHDAITKSKCDIILAPIYKLNVSTTSGKYTSKKYTMTVEGFGANIKSIKQVK